jgi:hypothetical protein
MYPRQNVPSNVSLTQDTGRFFDLVDNPVPDLSSTLRISCRVADGVGESSQPPPVLPL